MYDRIIIDSLELRARVGVPAEERTAAQRLTASLTLEPLGLLSNLDDRLDRTIDYHEVALSVKEIAESRSRQLIETIAEDIVLQLLQRFPLRSVQIELRKYVLPDTNFVAVRLQRSAAQIS